MFYWILKIFVFPAIRLIWVGKVDGLENIPISGGAIIASNHESYFDFICFLALHILRSPCQNPTRIAA